MSKSELKAYIKQLLEQGAPTTIINEDKPLRNSDHPTMKPVKLIAYMIRNSSRPGETVLDTFAGSGTTLIAAEQTGRTCYAVEYDPRYCKSRQFSATACTLQLAGHQNSFFAALVSVGTQKLLPAAM